MKLLLSAAAILLLATFHLTEAGHASASEARHLSDHPVMRSVRKSFVEEIADYFNTWVFHSVDRQARSNFKQIFGVDSNDAMKASTHRSLHTHLPSMGKEPTCVCAFSLINHPSPFRAGAARQDLRMVCLPPGGARLR